VPPHVEEAPSTRGPSGGFGGSKRVIGSGERRVAPRWTTELVQKFPWPLREKFSKAAEPSEIFVFARHREAFVRAARERLDGCLSSDAHQEIDPG
jgi:hypothetical protein